MSRVLLAKQTAAGNSEPFTVKKTKRRPAHFTAFGLVNDETVTIQMKQSDGIFYDYYDDILQQITATKSGILINGTGTYRGVKTLTISPVSIEVSTDDSP